MFYYAYLNELDVVQAIYPLPSQITDPRYILVPTNDQTLIGKKYNRITGQFEDAIFYYAVLSNKDLVVEVISSLTPITDSSKILIASNDTTLIGKWYNRQTAQFLDPPIHVLADHSTQQINLVNQDKWLQTELDEMKTKAAGQDTQLTNLAAQGQQLQTGLDAANSMATQHDSQLANLVTQEQQLQTGLTSAGTRLTSLENSSFGGYKCKFRIRDNQTINSDWAYSAGKDFTISFDTGLPGYFPRMIRLVDSNQGDDTLVAEFFIVKNPDGTVKDSYLDLAYVGLSTSSLNTTPTRFICHDMDMDDIVMTAFRNSSGRLFDEGGTAFIATGSFNANGSNLQVRNFNYTDNTFSFNIKVSSALVGSYTAMDLDGYVF